MDKLPPEIMANILNHLDTKDRSALVRAFDKTKRTGEVVPDPEMILASELSDSLSFLDDLNYFRIKEYAEQTIGNRNRVTRYFDQLYDRTVARFSVLHDVEKHELVERVYFMNGYHNADLTRIKVSYEPGEYGITTRSMTATPVEAGWDEYMIHEVWQSGSPSSPNDRIYYMDWMIGQRRFRLDGPAHLKIVNGVVRTELISDAYQHKEIAYNEAGEVVATFEDGHLTSDVGFFSEVFRPSITYIPW